MQAKNRGAHRGKSIKRESEAILKDYEELSRPPILLSRWWTTKSCRDAFKRAEEANKMTPEAKKKLREFSERKKAGLLPRLTPARLRKARRK